jgi:D-methionine transport system ATP-binding protein
VSTVVHAEPDAEELAHLRSRHDGRLVVLEIREGVDVGSVLSRAAAEQGVGFRIVFGGVSVLQEQSFGSLTVELLGDAQAVEDTIARLGQATAVKEVSA